jgi:hypothetical protein
LCGAAVDALLRFVSRNVASRFCRSQLHHSSCSKINLPPDVTARSQLIDVGKSKFLQSSLDPHGEAREGPPPYWHARC